MRRLSIQRVKTFVKSVIKKIKDTPDKKRVALQFAAKHSLFILKRLLTQRVKAIPQVKKLLEILETVNSVSQQMEVYENLLGILEDEEKYDCEERAQE